MKKLLSLTLVILLAMSVITGCGSKTNASESEDKVVKVGLNPSGVPIWEYVKKKAAKEGITVELVEFSDYVTPNLALANGDIDMNAFQTVSYFDAFIKERDLDLAPIATTLIAPMGLYSNKYKGPEEIPEDSTIALPQEATNMGRALLLLQSAGLIALPEDFDGVGDLSVIQSNPKNLKFEPVVAAQTPRVLPDVAASVINNGVAVAAGYTPVKDAIFLEDDTATPYINILAVQSEDVDDPTLQKLAEIYQTKDVAKHIKKVFDNSLIPTFVPLKKIGW